MTARIAIVKSLRTPSILVALTALLLVGAPLAGAWVAGQPLGPLLELPPRPGRIAAPGFSWIAFWLMAGLVIAAVTPLVGRFVATPRQARQAVRRAFPAWGYAALAYFGLSWLLAWTRFPWFEPFQQHTFTPLWLGYIAVVNALTVWRKGESIATRNPRRFIALFALSTLFWWFFEYLNRFAGNWRYVGADDFGAVEYTLFASAAYSTVLPAVASTADFLGTFSRLDAAFARWHEVRVPRPTAAAAFALAVTTLLLAALGTYPQHLYPLVWVSPALIIVTLQALGGIETVLAPLAQGDWRGLVTYATAAITCGFFWEMWNYGSLVRWQYSIPHVEAFRIFEMPLLGYAGYLPFGIECAVIAALVLDRKASIR
jgi:hypothetical protein